MPNPLFSTYSQGENRVTASILAVMERLSFGLTQQILQALLQEPETQLLSFRNQVSAPSSVPDAQIRASFSYWIETKIAPNAVSAQQIRAHLQAMDCEPSVDLQRLLVLTPDSTQPAALGAVADERIAWASFQDLLSAVELAAGPGGALLDTEGPTATERERELLRELARFLIATGLVGRSGDAVLVVPARRALAEYLELHAYICQPNRTFRPTSRMAFYHSGRIDRRVPSVVDVIESVRLSRSHLTEVHDFAPQVLSRLEGLISGLEMLESDRLGEEQKVIFLSAPEAPETVILDSDIVNDLVSESGQTVAFVQGQRYVSLASLRANPPTTSKLLALDQARQR